jgi:hypothetical protein
MARPQRFNRNFIVSHNSFILEQSSPAGRHRAALYQT